MLQSKGEKSERIAERFLKAQGYSVVARNYRCPAGEIDLIVQADGALRFVEVKGRWSVRQGSPLEQVHRAKQRHLARAAHYYIQRHPAWAEHRLYFSVLGIRWEGGEPQIDWIPEAFDLPDSAHFL